MLIMQIWGWTSKYIQMELKLTNILLNQTEVNQNIFEDKFQKMICSFNAHIHKTPLPFILGKQIAF